MQGVKRRRGKKIARGHSLTVSLRKPWKVLATTRSNLLMVELSELLLRHIVYHDNYIAT